LEVDFPPEKKAENSYDLETTGEIDMKFNWLSLSGILNHRLSLVSTDFGTSKDFLGTSKVWVLTEDSLLIQPSTES
jgi:hypothetical protein